MRRLECLPKGLGHVSDGSCRVHSLNIRLVARTSSSKAESAEKLTSVTAGIYYWWLFRQLIGALEWVLRVLKSSNARSFGFVLCFQHRNLVLLTLSVLGGSALLKLITSIFPTF